MRLINKEIYKPDFFNVYVEESIDPRAKFDYKIAVDFQYVFVKDIVVKGEAFAGFWDGEQWTMDEHRMIQLIDVLIDRKYRAVKSAHPDARISVAYMNNERSGIMNLFHNYCKKQVNSDVQFNKHILFSDVVPKREDYSTYQLPYTPTPGLTPAFDKLSQTLYEKSELDKILWSLGALFTGDIARIEKFLFLYGAKGTGKGTMLKIIQQLTGDYWAPIDLRQLTSGSEFATSDVKELPVFMDTDCDLSKINNEQNLLKLTSHEDVLVRKLYKQGYPVRFMGLLVTASNERFKLKNLDSGITRRALVVRPTNVTVPRAEYLKLTEAIKFELPYIAQKCIDRFLELGSDKYDDVVDVDMIVWGDKIFDFMRSNYQEIKNGITLNRATSMYKIYLEDMGWSTNGAKRDMKAALSTYFKQFAPDTTDDAGARVYNYYFDLDYNRIFPENTWSQPKDVTDSIEEESKEYWLNITEHTTSIFFEEGKEWPAQYATDKGTPQKAWSTVGTKLSDIDEHKLHYVQVPENHVVIDFDIHDENGNKDLDANLKAACAYPETYAEVSKSGGGVHLHYQYDGDPFALKNRISDDIEVKVYTGKSSLRRLYTKSNNLPIAHIASGLPLREKDENMYKDIEDIVWTEKTLLSFVRKALNKEHHGATAPEIDFIHHVLQQAYESGVSYDLSSVEMDVIRFAMQSTHQAEKCMSKVAEMHFQSEDKAERPIATNSCEIIPNDELFMYDIEVFSNLLLVCYKRSGVEFPEDFFNQIVMTEDMKSVELSSIATSDVKEWHEKHKADYGFMFNPAPSLIEELCRKPLVGFNNRKYDNHILYNAMMAFTNQQLYQQSQDIIGNNKGTVGSAYNLSYLDVYEMHDIKMSLKKWEIKLNIPHDEFEFPWDKPLDKSNWLRCGIYCMHDVCATDKVFLHDLGQAAYTARKILATLTGSPINTKTQTLAARFMFGDDKRPQDKFVWYDLAKEFPGYTFDKYRKPKSLYKGKDPSEGGYVSAKPGVYGFSNSREALDRVVNGRKQDIIYIDVESLHPHSLIAINYFGPYTPKFAALVKCRMHIKHGEFEEAAHAFDEVDPELSNKLQPYLQDPSQASALGHAMKIVINIIYGMTSASYDNEFRSPLNIDNIIAKRGALFMMMLEEEMEARGANVVHVKTDSMKITNYTDEDIEYAFKRANEYGYNFAVECVYDRMALVNNAVLIGQSKDIKKHNGWEAVGAQFAVPFTFKSLFSQEEIVEEDFRMEFQTQSAITVDGQFIGKNAELYASRTGGDALRQNIVDVSKSVYLRYSKPIEDYLPKKLREGLSPIEVEDNRRNRIAKEVKIDRTIVDDIINTNFEPYMYDKPTYVTGTRGHKWRLWSQYASKKDLDMSYYTDEAQKAVDSIFDKGDGNIIFEGTKYERTYETA